MRANLPALAGCLALVALSAAPVTVSAQSPPSPGQPRSVFLQYDDLAKAAARGGEKEIDALVDSYLMHSIAFPAGPSIRRRLVNAELAYRTKKQRPIGDGDVVKAMNVAAKKYMAPSFMRTTDAQVGLVKQVLERGAPALDTLSCENEGGDPNAMSPAYAGLLLTFLATQKFVNGNYQIEPDVWVLRTRSQMRGAELFPGKVRVREQPTRWRMPGAVDRMLAEPPADTNMFTRLMHGILDDMGVAR